MERESLSREILFSEHCIVRVVRYIQDVMYNNKEKSLSICRMNIPRRDVE